jgi:putative flippase GtrA
MQIKQIHRILFRHKKTFKFLIVGGACAAYNLAALYCLTSIFRFYYLFSFVFVFFTGNLIGFYLNKYYTFNTPNNLFWRELVKYYSVMTSNLLLGVFLMFFMVNILKIWYFYAMIFLTVGGTAYNFWLHNKWSFRKR